MKIIAVADLHGNLPKDVPECDLLVIAGDICPHFGVWTKPGSPEDINGQIKWFSSIFLPWAGKQPAKSVVATWGNHDFLGQSEEIRDNDIAIAFTIPENFTLLLDAAVFAQSQHIYGTPYTPCYFDWAFMETEDKLAERFARIPEGLDILISHGPPLWACDRAAGDKGDHIGSKVLYERISTMQKPPKLLICGHIHGGKGEGFVFGEHGAVHVWNVAGVDEAYSPHSPMWTEIKPIEKETTSGVSV